MRFDWLLRISSLLICAVLAIWAYEGKHSAYQLVFGMAVYASLVYQHGYKLYLKRGRRQSFFVFYLLPFCIAVLAVESKIISLLD
jgi:hypothetical protein